MYITFTCAPCARSLASHATGSHVDATGGGGRPAAEGGGGGGGGGPRGRAGGAHGGAGQGPRGVRASGARILPKSARRPLRRTARVHKVHRLCLLATSTATVLPRQPGDVVDDRLEEGGQYCACTCTVTVQAQAQAQYRPPSSNPSSTTSPG
eukprot:1180243-Prorocentrum_minimum.AAC.1